MKATKEERAEIESAAHIYHAKHSTTGWKTVIRGRCPERDPICNGIARLIADVDDAEALLERVRPILCGLAIEVEQKQKVEGTHYLTDAVAVKDEVCDFLKEPSNG